MLRRLVGMFEMMFGFTVIEEIDESTYCVVVEERAREYFCGTDNLTGIGRLHYTRADGTTA
jgi:hypothetical protein